MDPELETKAKPQKDIVEDAATTEYTVAIDGVVEIRSDVDDKVFFDGLFDAIIEYVEKHNASAGLSISHEKFNEENTDTDHGVTDDRENA